MKAVAHRTVSAPLVSLVLRISEVHEAATSSEAAVVGVIVLYLGQGLNSTVPLSGDALRFVFFRRDGRPAQSIVRSYVSNTHF